MGIGRILRASRADYKESRESLHPRQHQRRTIFYIRERRFSQNTPKRENGAGSVYKRSDSVNRPWVAVAPAIYFHDERTKEAIKQQLVIGRFETRKEARAAIEKYMLCPSLKLNYSLEDVFNEWKAWKWPQIGKSTREGYDAAWSHLNVLKDERFRDLKLQQLSQTIADCDLSASSMEKQKALLTQLYDYAILHDIVQKNIASHIVLTKKQKPRTDTFSKEDIDIMWKNLDKVEDVDLLLILCYTGLRATELCKLTKFQYDPKEHILTGGIKTAAGIERCVPVHHRIVPLIEKRIAMGQNWIIERENGKPHNKDSLLRRIKKVTATLGISNLPTHAARHTCATRMSAAGIRPEDIKAIIGHSDYSTTANIYINQDKETLISSMEMLA